jgi:hypothetical protein
MITKSEILEQTTRELQLSESEVKVEQSGQCYWVDFKINHRVFVLQISLGNDGVGASETTIDGNDFGGHDQVFINVIDALNYIKTLLLNPPLLRDKLGFILPRQ